MEEVPPASAPSQRPSQRIRKRHLVPTAIVIAIGLFILFFCSGLQLPVWRPEARLNRRLSRDLGLSLPAGAFVTHAVSVATRDPAEYYAVEMPAADAATFMALVKQVHSGRAQSVESPADRPWTMGPAPDWWKPAQLPNVQRLDTGVQDPQSGYVWYYSDAAGTVYVFWFEA